LRGVTAAKRIPPTLPAETITTPVADLQKLADHQDGLKTGLKAAEIKLATLPTPSPYKADQLDEIEAEAAAYRRWDEKSRLLEGTPNPGVTTQSVREAMEFQEAEHLRRRITDLKAKGTHTCPSCAWQWPIEASGVDAMEAELEALETVTAPEGLPTERGALTSLLRAAEAWENIQPQLAPLADVAPCPRPAQLVTEIEMHRSRVGFDQIRTDLTDEISRLKADLGHFPDYVAQLRDRQRYEDRLTFYTEQLVDYAA